MFEQKLHPCNDTCNYSALVIAHSTAQCAFLIVRYCTSFTVALHEMRSFKHSSKIAAGEQAMSAINDTECDEDILLD